MNIFIITLFPEIFESVFTKSIIKRALDKKIVDIRLINLRIYGLGKHKQVDDKPYGGGEGMVLMIEPIERAIKEIKPKPYIVLTSASGRKFNQQKAQTLSRKKNLAIICGHYEGTDERIDTLVDEVLTIGDFVLTGGEIPAMMITDAVTRLLPNVIKTKSTEIESFSEEKTLEYPQYTRPENYKGLKVPEILLRGNHQAINKWRQQQALVKTKKNRPDLT